MKKILLILAVTLGVIACQKEPIIILQDPAIVTVTIDNSNSNTNNNNNVSENWQSAASTSSANAASSAEAWVSTVAIYGEGNDDPNALNTDVPVSTSFGINAFGFGSSTNDVSSSKTAYMKYNPILSTKTNLNNWLETVTPSNKLTAAIGDLNMLGLADDSDDYHHKFSTASNTLSIFHEGTLITSITTNSKDLYEGNSPTIILAEGNYTWSYSDDGGAVDGISQYLPFTLNGEFRAYGQNIAISADADSTASYFTIDKAVTADSNGNFSGVAPTINGQSLNDETDVLIHVDEDGTQFKSDYWYTYVAPGTTYDFEFFFNDGTDDFTVANTTVDIAENFHYNCIFRVLVSDDADSGVGVVSVEFDQNTWETKVVSVYVGGINVKEVFEISDEDYSDTWPELLIVDKDFNGVDGQDKWYTDSECYYIVTDGNTTMTNLFLYNTSDDTLAHTYTNQTGDTAGETQMVLNALKSMYDGGDVCSVYTDADQIYESYSNTSLIGSTGNVYTSDIPGYEKYHIIFNSSDGVVGTLWVIVGDSAQDPDGFYLTPAGVQSSSATTYSTNDYTVEEAFGLIIDAIIAHLNSGN